MIRSRMLLLSLLSSTALAAPVLAQDVLALDEIVVSGGLLPVSQSAYGRAYSILTAEQIATRGLTTVQQAIRALPGVAVEGSDPYNTQVRIRGGEGNHVLVLIDGVEATMGENGEYYFSGLELADVERIEVLRGPQSVIYGSNAATGGIAIYTKRAQTAGTSYQTGVEYGTAGSYAGDFAVRTRGEKGELAFSLQHRDEAGFDQSGDGGDRDGSRRTTANLTGRWQLSDTFSTGFTLRHSDQDFDFDADNWAATDADSYIVDSGDYGKRRETLASVWLQADTLGGQLQQRLTLSGNDFDTKRYDATGSLTSMALSQRETVAYRLAYALDGAAVDQSRQRVTLLAEHDSEVFRRETGGTRYARNANGLALEYQGSYDNGLDVQAGVRQDFNAQFQNATTWNLAASYPLGAARLHGSLGKAVVNPTMYEQFGYTPGFYTGNPDLKPEESLGFDIGVELPFAGGRGTVDMTLFAENLENEIVYSPSYTTALNSDGLSQRRGVEVSGNWQATDRLGFGFSYTYTKSSDADGAPEVRRPRHQLGLDATWAFAQGQGSVTLGMRHVADTWDTQYWGSYATEKLEDYTVVNLSGKYALTPKVDLVGRIENLTDSEYSEVWGYATAGRTAYVGLRGTF